MSMELSGISTTTGPQVTVHDWLEMVRLPFAKAQSDRAAIAHCREHGPAAGMSWNADHRRKREVEAMLGEGLREDFQFPAAVEIIG